MLWTVLLGVLAGVMVLWLSLVIVLWRAQPDESSLREALRLLPDLLRLLPRLARDPALPRGARIRLWLLLAYLAMPFDLIPDFIPIIGYADDAIIVAAVLRSVVRRSGRSAIERHWPGTPDGLVALERLARLDRA